MDVLVSEISTVLFNSYLSDIPAFRSTRQYPSKNLFFELTQLQKIFFPDFFCNTNQIDISHMQLELTLLVDHLLASISAYNDDEFAECCLHQVVKSLPEIRETLKTDLIAAYAGDPAAPGLPIIIRCYPGFQAVMIHRVAHVMYTCGERWYCRELQECIHSLTSIDIHPGASIGSHFFIDHGVGVVIGETCVIGEWCRLYQSVTLGALHFQEEGGILKRGAKRHPTVGDFVTIGTGARVLGNITVGSYVRIGANCWISENVDKMQVVYIKEHPEHMVKPCKNCCQLKSDEEILKMIMPAPADRGSVCDINSNSK
ncbi:serine O-acetyltransferase [Entamoeba marina]